MVKIRPIQDYCNSGTRGYMFWCPGCKTNHSFRVVALTEEEKTRYPYLLNRDGSSPVWSFNGSVDKPTFFPSLLYNYSQDKRCHLFLEDGVIKFLSDCTHEYAGQNVQMSCFECHSVECKHTNSEGFCS